METRNESKTNDSNMSSSNESTFTTSKKSLLHEQSNTEANNIQIKTSTTSIRPPIIESSSSVYFKIYVVATMIGIWSSYTLLIKYTQTDIPKEKLYFSSVIPFFSEIGKILISLIMLFYEVEFNPQKFLRSFNNNLLKKPIDLLKMSPPAICYIIQNNLDIIAMKNLPAGVFQVTSQLKIISTAIFMVIFLKKKISIKKWICIVFCFIGIAIVQIGNMTESNSSNKNTSENPIIGLISILIICIVAGFAGVYFEKMLKDGSQSSLWVRNIQLYFWGIPSALLWIFIDKGSEVIDKGLFHGFNYKIWIAIGLAAIGGIYISLIMKYLDNIQKSFAATCTIIVVTIISVIIFTNVTISLPFFIGSSIAIGAIISYNKLK
uniref:UDP-galactose transporter n=1 Tax=Parastrongyloides trichosuri TaxID=131310 RepID=A0A0N4Z294_PARTI